MNVWDVRLKPGHRPAFRVSESWTTGLFVLKGRRGVRDHEGFVAEIGRHARRGRHAVARDESHDDQLIDARVIEKSFEARSDERAVYGLVDRALSGKRRGLGLPFAARLAGPQ